MSASTVASSCSGVESNTVLQMPSTTSWRPLRSAPTRVISSAGRAPIIESKIRPMAVSNEAVSPRSIGSS
jgi:hypothetical protein